MGQILTQIFVDAVAFQLIQAYHVRLSCAINNLPNAVLLHQLNVVVHLFSITVLFFVVHVLQIIAL
jgi:hypothetical protein